MAFLKRRVEATIKLAGGGNTNQPNTFTESGSNTVTLQGSRTSVRITNSGTPSGSTASVDIYGLTPSIMNQLATLGLVYNIIERNTVTIQAGDDQVGMSTVFSGTITAGYADLNSSPDVPFHIEANSGLADAVVSAPVSTFPGATDVATIMSGLARQMNVGFENNGVNVRLRNPYFSGNILTQVRNCAQHANINAEVINGVLAIWPKGGNRNTPDAPLVSAQTGMKGYPTFTQNGIMLQTLFNPKIAFGGLITVQSIVTDAAAQSKSASTVTGGSSSLLPANGQWAVYKLDHALDAEVPKGQWLSTIAAYNPKFPRPVVPGPRG